MMKSNIVLRKDVGVFIRQARLDKSLTGYQLAKILETSQQQISRYERGEIGINIEILNDIFIALEKNWFEFFLKVLKHHSEENYDLWMLNDFLLKNDFYL